MKYFILILSLIQPIYAFPFAIFESIKKKSRKISLFSIALAFAFLTFNVIPPEGFDLSRHYQRIISLRELPLEIILSNSTTGYYLFDIYAWIVNSLQLPKEFFPASIVFCSYFLIFSVFNDIKVNFLQHDNQIYILLAFIILWLSIGYIGLVSGLRNPFANIIMVYLSYHLIFYKKLTSFIIGSLFAFFVHPFSIALSIITLIAYFFVSWFKKPKILIIIGIFLTIGNKIITFGIDYIVNILIKFNLYSSTYFDQEGEFGASYLSNRNLNGIIIAIIIPRIPIYLGMLYLLTLKPKSNDKMYLLLSLISVYLGFLFSYYTLTSRMMSFFLFALSIYLILIQSNNQRSRFDKIVLFSYVGSLVLSSVAALYTYQNFVLSSLPDVILKPLFFALFGI